MKLFEISILIFFTLWLLVATWVALSNRGRFQRVRKFLSFNGWFNQWTMFMPDKGGKIERFQISYRDKTRDGELGPWQMIEFERPWKPTLFLVNPDIRLYGLMLKAVRSFAHLSDIGREPRDASLFNFFHSVMLSYDKDKEAYQRQIKVGRFVDNDEVVLIESDFLELP